MNCVEVLMLAEKACTGGNGGGCPWLLHSGAVCYCRAGFRPEEGSTAIGIALATPAPEDREERAVQRREDCPLGQGRIDWNANVGRRTVA